MQPADYVILGALAVLLFINARPKPAGEKKPAKQAAPEVPQALLWIGRVNP